MQKYSLFIGLNIYRDDVREASAAAAIIFSRREDTASEEPIVFSTNSDKTRCMAISSTDLFACARLLHTSEVQIIISGNSVYTMRSNTDHISKEVGVHLLI